MSILVDLERKRGEIGALLLGWEQRRGGIQGLEALSRQLAI